MCACMLSQFHIGINILPLPSIHVTSRSPQSEIRILEVDRRCCESHHWHWQKSEGVARKEIVSALVLVLAKQKMAGCFYCTVSRMPEAADGWKIIPPNLFCSCYTGERLTLNINAHKLFIKWMWLENVGNERDKRSVQCSGVVQPMKAVAWKVRTRLAALWEVMRKQMQWQQQKIDMQVTQVYSSPLVSWATKKSFQGNSGIWVTYLLQYLTPFCPSWPIAQTPENRHNSYTNQHQFYNKDTFQNCTLSFGGGTLVKTKTFPFHPFDYQVVCTRDTYMQFIALTNRDTVTAHTCTCQVMLPCAVDDFAAALSIKRFHAKS
jgi:hypothetical protein